MNKIVDCVATKQCSSTNLLLLSGNVIFNEWYRSITYKASPDLIPITILANIIAWWGNFNKIFISKDSNKKIFNSKLLYCFSINFLKELFSSGRGNL